MRWTSKLLLTLFVLMSVLALTMFFFGRSTERSWAILIRNNSGADLSVEAIRFDGRLSKLRTPQQIRSSPKPYPGEHIGVKGPNRVTSLTLLGTSVGTAFERTCELPSGAKDGESCIAVVMGLYQRLQLSCACESREDFS